MIERERERERGDLLCTPAEECGSTTPELGLTQYCLGAVVFTLKQTGASLMFSRVKTTVFVSVNGPTDTNAYNL